MGSKCVELVNLELRSCKVFAKKKEGLLKVHRLERLTLCRRNCQ